VVRVIIVLMTGVTLMICHGSLLCSLRLYLANARAAGGFTPAAHDQSTRSGLGVYPAPVTIDLIATKSVDPTTLTSFEAGSAVTAVPGNWPSIAFLIVPAQ